MSSQEPSKMHFHEAMFRIYDECTKFGYHPKIFLSMVHEHGG